MEPQQASPQQNPPSLESKSFILPTTTTAAASVSAAQQQDLSYHRLFQLFPATSQSITSSRPVLFLVSRKPSQKRVSLYARRRSTLEAVRFWPNSQSISGWRAQVSPLSASKTYSFAPTFP